MYHYKYKCFLDGSPKPPNYLRTTRTTSGLRPDYLRTTSGLPPDYLRTTPGLPPDYCRTTSGLSPDYLRTTAGLPPDYLRTTVGLPPDYLRTTSGLPPDYLPLQAVVKTPFFPKPIKGRRQCRSVQFTIRTRRKHIASSEDRPIVKTEA